MQLRRCSPLRLRQRALRRREVYRRGGEGSGAPRRDRHGRKRRRRWQRREAHRRGRARGRSFVLLVLIVHPLCVFSMACDLTVCCEPSLRRWRSLLRHWDRSAGATRHRDRERNEGGCRRRPPLRCRPLRRRRRRRAPRGRFRRLERATSDGVVLTPARDEASVAAVRVAALRVGEEARAARATMHRAHAVLREGGALQLQRVDVPSTVALGLEHAALPANIVNASRPVRLDEGLLRHRGRSAGATRHRDRRRCPARGVFRCRLTRPRVEIGVLGGATCLITPPVEHARGARAARRSRWR